MRFDTSKPIKEVGYNSVKWNISSKVDSNIVPENIKGGVSILGVQGTYEPSGEWEPNKDMKYMKKVCENDVQEGFTYKVLQMVSDGYRYTDIVVPSGGAVKTSDGHYYTTNTKHTWDTTQDIQPLYYKNMKLRWLIYYYSSETPTITLLDDVMYACFNGVKFDKIFRDKYLLEYFDIINGANIKSNITDFRYMFYNCYSLQNVQLDTSSGNDFSNTFYNCYSLQNVQLDTSSGTNFSNMFYNCHSLQNVQLDTSSGTNFSSIFGSCYSLQVIKLDTVSGTNLAGMFSGCKSLQSIKLNTVNCTNFQNMLRSCQLLQSAQLDMTNGINVNFVFLESPYMEFVKITNLSKSFNLSYSTKYSRDTIVNDIFSGLVDLTGQAQQTLTLGSTNLAKLSEEDKAIATNKNWILA